MKLVSKFSVFIIVLMIVFSCKNKFTEEVQKSPDGRVEKVTKYKIDGDKKEIVKETRFYANGNKEVEGEYKNEKKHGKWTYWFESGDVWSEGEFDNGERTGESKVYSKEKKLVFTGYYKKGKPDGKWVFYNKEGNPEKEVIFKNGAKASEKEL